MNKLYRVGRLQQNKWATEINEMYPIGLSWTKIAKHSSKKLLQVIVYVLSKLDRDF